MLIYISLCVQYLYSILRSVVRGMYSILTDVLSPKKSSEKSKQESEAVNRWNTYLKLNFSLSHDNDTMEYKYTYIYKLFNKQ